MRVSVHATPGARRNHVGGCHADALRVSVTAAADKGRANKAIAKVLADALGVKLSQIELISGQTNRRKVFEINQSPAGLAEKVSELMAGG
jgi:uncharacterized protein (TIGR00251 family)